VKRMEIKLGSIETSFGRIEVSVKKEGENELLVLLIQGGERIRIPFLALSSIIGFFEMARDLEGRLREAGYVLSDVERGENYIH